MTNSNLKSRIKDYLWPFGVSLLTGLVALYLASLALFACGISITRLHALAFFPPALAACYFTLPPSGLKTRLKRALYVMSGITVAGAGFIGVASQLDDLSIDGMGARIEPVLALSAGWNPIRDSQGTTLPVLARAHPQLAGGILPAINNHSTMGSVISANLVAWTGNLNAGKAINPLLVLAVIGIAYGGLTALSTPAGWSVALAAMTALNPVSIYQSSSYYIDGQTGAMFAVMIFSALRLLAKPGEVMALGTMVLSFIGLSATKTSGIFYGIIIFAVFLIFYVFLRPGNWKTALILLLAGALLAWPSFTFLRKACRFPDASRNYLQTVTSSSPGYGYGGGASAIKEIFEMNKLEMFIFSHFAPCDSIPDQIKTKFPFYFNRRELALFEELSPDPRAGGFGPLYGGCLLLGLGSLAVLFWVPGKPIIAAYFPLVSVVISVALTQTWWARWAPQGWLIPVCLVLPVLTSLQSHPARRLWVSPLLCVFTGLLNSILILAFYTSGCWQAQKILNSQLAFLKTLPPPVEVQMPTFASNRTWFFREKISFRIIDSSPEKPRMRLMRTDTTLALPVGWESQAGASVHAAAWKKRGLLEE